MPLYRRSKPSATGTSSFHTADRRVISVLFDVQRPLQYKAQASHRCGPHKVLWTVTPEAIFAFVRSTTNTLSLSYRGLLCLGACALEGSGNKPGSRSSKIVSAEAARRWLSTIKNFGLVTLVIDFCCIKVFKSRLRTECTFNRRSGARMGCSARPSLCLPRAVRVWDTSTFHLPFRCARQDTSASTRFPAPVRSRMWCTWSPWC